MKHSRLLWQPMLLPFSTTPRFMELHPPTIPTTLAVDTPRAAAAAAAVAAVAAAAAAAEGGSRNCSEPLRAR